MQPTVGPGAPCYDALQATLTCPQFAAMATSGDSRRGQGSRISCRPVRVLRPAGWESRLDTPALHTSIRQIATPWSSTGASSWVGVPGIYPRATQSSFHPASNPFGANMKFWKTKERRSMGTGVEASSQVKAELPRKDFACRPKTGWSEQKGIWATQADKPRGPTSMVEPDSDSASQHHSGEGTHARASKAPRAAEACVNGACTATRLVS